jgi:hypothetical protein
MPYYPKSQIKSGLYTSGDEYTLTPPPNNFNADPYVGYYYQVSNGNKYTGKTPQDGPSSPLYSLNLDDLSLNNSTTGIPLPTINYYVSPFSAQESINNNQYLKTTNNFPTPRTIPQFNLTLPTQNDYSLGVFSRYFCKKNNENRYLEIDQPTYQDLNIKKPTIAWDLYTPITTLWYLTGNKDTIYKANKGLISLIEKDQKWYGFSQYFKDNFLQYYLVS